MSTRGSFGFRVEGQDFLFRYIYDTFPAHLLKYLTTVFEKNNYDVKSIKKACKNLLHAKDNDLQHLVKLCYSIASDEEDQYLKEHIDSVTCLDDIQYIITHEIGIFTVLLKYKFDKLKIDNNFIKHGLFCEYAYIFNLDENVLEIYTGSPEVAGSGRYIHNDTGDIGCHLLHTVSFNRLKSLEDSEKDILCSHDIIYDSYTDKRKQKLRESDTDLERRLKILENILNH